MRAYLDDAELDRLSQQAAVTHARLRAHLGACGVCGGLQTAAETTAGRLVTGCEVYGRHQRALDGAEALVTARLRHLRG